MTVDIGKIFQERIVRSIEEPLFAVDLQRSQAIGQPRAVLTVATHHHHTQYCPVCGTETTLPRPCANRHCGEAERAHQARPCMACDPQYGEYELALRRQGERPSRDCDCRWCCIGRALANTSVARSVMDEVLDRVASEDSECRP